MGHDQLRHLLVAHRAVDAVAALHDDVPGAEIHAEHVDADDQLAPEAAGQHVPPRMGARVLGREEAVLHLLPHPGVVLGELRERPLAPEEEAAVPDVRRHQRPAHHRARGEGGPHAAQLGHRDRLVVELEVGLLDGAPETLRQRPAARRAVHLARQDLEGERARHLAGGVAAEPVGHREEDAVLVRPVADRVLVPLADAADVGQLEELDLGHERRGPAAPKAAGPLLSNLSRALRPRASAPGWPGRRAGS